MPFFCRYCDQKPCINGDIAKSTPNDEYGHEWSCVQERKVAKGEKKKKKRARLSSNEACMDDHGHDNNADQRGADRDATWADDNLNEEDGQENDEDDDDDGERAYEFLDTLPFLEDYQQDFL